MINCTISEEEQKVFEKNNYNPTYGELSRNGIQNIIDYATKIINTDNLSKYTFVICYCYSIITISSIFNF